MDLRNHKITVGELLDDPRSLAVLKRRFGRWINHPKVSQKRGLTLAQLIQMSRLFVSPAVVQETLRELESL